MCEKGNTVVLDLPDGIDPGKKNRSISCDYCCVKVLIYLWKNNIQTRGHCCGHFKRNPSIVIADGYDDFDIDRIYSLIKDVDDRQFDIFQWRLVKIDKAALNYKRARYKIG
jgi:hypothetical protein